MMYTHQLNEISFPLEDQKKKKTNQTHKMVHITET